jgi:hypothetical protein
MVTSRQRAGRLLSVNVGPLVAFARSDRGSRDSRAGHAGNVRSDQP